MRKEEIELELLVDGKLKFKDDGYYQRLLLKIKFKLPNKIMKTKLTRELSSSRWINDDNEAYVMFQDTTIAYLEDFNLIEKNVIDMIEKFMKNNKDKYKMDEKEKLIYDIIKDKKFKIKVKI